MQQMAVAGRHAPERRPISRSFVRLPSPGLADLLTPFIWVSQTASCGQRGYALFFAQTDRSRLLQRFPSDLVANQLSAAPVAVDRSIRN